MVYLKRNVKIKRQSEIFETYHHDTAEESDATLNSILDLIVEGIWDWNAISGHVNRSPGWYRMLGYDVGVLKNDVFTWENIIHPDDYESVMEHFERYIGGEIEEYAISYRCKKKDGDYIWIFDQGKIVSYKPDGSVARMIGSHLNINKQKVAQSELVNQNEMLHKGNLTLEKVVRKKAEELEKKNSELEAKIIEVERLSNTDMLTAIANRKKFEDELAKEILRSRRYGHPVSLMMFDIDFFKRINDTYGHDVGDTILQGLSKLVSINIREIDFFARWGGEEFVIIFPGVSLDNAIIASEKLRLLISQYEFGSDIFITCSFGVTELSKDDTIKELFFRVDKLLYQAKERGRNRVESVMIVKDDVL